MQVLFVGVLRCLCIFVPFVAFQAYGYYNICLGHLPDEMSPWCKARVPLVYNYLQSHYWYVFIYVTVDYCFSLHFPSPFFVQLLMLLVFLKRFAPYIHMDMLGFLLNYICRGFRFLVPCP